MIRNLREALADKLSKEELQRIRAFDIVGDIAIMKIPDELADKKRIIAEAIMRVHKNVKVVLNQVSPVSGEFRTRELEWLAGEKRTETFHRENGCVFKVDLARVYFSPRLSTERMRIVKMVQQGEVVVNMFAGVGCYSIQIAKYSNPRVVYSIDINPSAYELMVENIRLNKVGHKVLPILGDCREVIRNLLTNSCDRVLMPLPEFGREFFSVALLAIGDKGIVHFYDYGQEPDVFEPSEKYVIETAEKLGFQTEIIGRRKVRSYAPRCYHVAIDVLVRRI
ncbi:MAG: class I SAM-dependent methyltransferase family protein [Candidatus Hadarchaeales archaeon]